MGDLHAKVWHDALRDYGHEVAFQDIRDQIGKGGDQLLPVFLSSDELEAKGDELDRHRGEILRQRYLSKIKAFPGVRALFQRLKQDGIQIVLASSAKADELEVYKKVAEIQDLVDTETSSDDAEKSKPHPDIVDAALSRLNGIQPADVVVIGNTPYDAESAGKADLRTVGVLCGGFPEDRLREAGCIAIYRSPADLLSNTIGRRCVCRRRQAAQRLAHPGWRALFGNTRPSCESGCAGVG